MSRSPGGSWRYIQPLSSDDNDAALVSSTVCMDCCDSEFQSVLNTPMVHGTHLCGLSHPMPNRGTAPRSTCCNEQSACSTTSPFQALGYSDYRPTISSACAEPYPLRFSIFPTPQIPHPELPISLTTPPAISGSRLELTPELRIQQVQDVIQQARTWTLLSPSQQTPNNFLRTLLSGRIITNILFSRPAHPLLIPPRSTITAATTRTPHHPRAVVLLKTTTEASRVVRDIILPNKATTAPLSSSRVTTSSNHRARCIIPRSRDTPLSRGIILVTVAMAGAPLLAVFVLVLWRHWPAAAAWICCSKLDWYGSVDVCGASWVGIESIDALRNRVLVDVSFEGIFGVAGSLESTEGWKKVCSEYQVLQDSAIPENWIGA